MLASGLLNRKGQVCTWDWKPRYFELHGQELRCYRKKGDAEPKSRVTVGAVRDVPERGGGKRANRIDIVLGKGADARVMSLAATSEDEKRKWVDAFAAASSRLDPSDHRRAAEFEGTALAQRMDQDGDGKVDAHELAEATGVAEDEARAIIAEHDVDGDGKLDASELAAMAAGSAPEPELQTRGETL